MVFSSTGETPFRVFVTTRSKRKRGLHRAAPIFNTAVSKVKFPQSNLSTRLGAKKHIGESGNGERLESPSILKAAWCVLCNSLSTSNCVHTWKS